MGKGWLSEERLLPLWEITSCSPSTHELQLLLKWGSGAAKVPMQRWACLSLLSPAKPGTGLVLSSLRQGKAKTSKSRPQAPTPE